MEDDLERAARIAAEPDAPIATRVDALTRVVDETSLRGVAIPSAIGDAIDDLALVDGAIARRRAGAVIAAVALLGPRPELASSRRRVVRRLVAAGATGIALAGLAIEIGDVTAGVALVVRDYRASILPRLGSPSLGSPGVGSGLGSDDAVVGAWLGVVAEQPDAAVVAILRALVDAGASLERLFAQAPDDRRAGRLRQLSRRMAAS